MLLQTFHSKLDIASLLLMFDAWGKWSNVKELIVIITTIILKWGMVYPTTKKLLLILEIRKQKLTSDHRQLRHEIRDHTCDISDQGLMI